MKLTLLIISVIFLSRITFSQGGVSINNTGAAPDNSAMLDVSGNNKGVLVPNISLTGTFDAVTIASPATSLLIYNNATAGITPNDVTPGFYYWDGVQWLRFVAGTIVGSDDQNLTGATLSGLILQTDIENGTSVSVDLSPIADSAFTQIINNADTLFSNTSFTDSLLSFIYNNGDTLINNSSFINALSDSIDTDVDSVTLAGTILTVYENGVGYFVDVASLQDGVNDADSDPTNEHNTGVNLTGTNFNIIDGGSTLTVDMAPLLDSAYSKDEWKDSDSLAMNGFIYANQAMGNGDTVVVTDNGNIGIGTSNPLTFLHIKSLSNSPVIFESTAPTSRIRILDLTGEISLSSLNNNIYFTTNGYSISNDTKMTILNNGNVGIGNTSPTSKLDISNVESTIYNGNAQQLINAGTTIRINNDDVTVGSFSQLVFTTRASQAGETRIVSINEGIDQSSMTFVTETGSVISEKMRINHDGNVGVGTQSPTFNLDVDSTINTGGHYRQFGNVVLTTRPNNSALSLNNTALGSNALINNSTGTSNTASGFSALNTNTTGSHNVSNGYQSLMSNTTGNHNVANGYQSLMSNITGDQNVANGSRSLMSNTTGYQNVANGPRALMSNTTGYSNVATGYRSLESNSMGFGNVANGAFVLQNNTTGNYNVAFGYASLQNNTTGNYNVANGYSALRNNTTGSYNTAIGYLTSNTGTANNNSTALGYNTQISNSNQIHLGNSAVTLIRGQVNFTTYSDARIKDNVSEDVVGLDFITKLRPVTYNFNIEKQNKIMGIVDSSEYEQKYDLEKIKMTGFIAQEVEQAAKSSNYNFSGLKIPSGDEKLYGISYAEFVVPLVKATQEQQETLVKQQSEIELQKNNIKMLEDNIKLLKDQLLLQQIQIEKLIKKYN